MVDSKFTNGTKYLRRPYSFKYFKGCLPKILLGPFLNTLTQMLLMCWLKLTLSSNCKPKSFTDDITLICWLSTVIRWLVLSLFLLYNIIARNLSGFTMKKNKKQCFQLFLDWTRTLILLVHFLRTWSGALFYLHPKNWEQWIKFDLACIENCECGATIVSLAEEHYFNLWF